MAGGLRPRGHSSLVSPRASKSTLGVSLSAPGGRINGDFRGFWGCYGKRKIAGESSVVVTGEGKLAGMRYTCEGCGKIFNQSGPGRSPRFCSSKCRVASSRSSVKIFPRNMTSRRRWTRADGKRPIMIDGSPASSTDAGTWATYRQVREGAGDGFGYMLGGGVGCYVLDDCVEDGAIQSWANKFVHGIPADVIHSEISLSGTGLNVFVRAAEGPGSSLGGVERYTRDRFIRCTGNGVLIV